MMRSLYSGVAGLKTHQTKMDVIGNNIANVNTTSFKSQSITFSDLMYQTTQTASGATETRGGVNARQIGLGAKSGAINTAIEGQGATQTTNNPFDIMINGKSFFIVNSGAEQLYTRDGSFYVDGAGNLAMQSNGYFVMGWAAQEDRETGEITINKGELTQLQIMSAANNTYSPASTTAALVSGNIDDHDTNILSDDGKTITLEFYDNKGYLYTGKFTLKDTGTEHLYAITLTDIIDSKGNSLGSEMLDLVSFGSLKDTHTTTYQKSGNYEFEVTGAKGEYVNINAPSGDTKYADVPNSDTSKNYLSDLMSTSAKKYAGVLNNVYGVAKEDEEVYGSNAIYTINSTGDPTTNPNWGEITITYSLKDVDSVGYATDLFSFGPRGKVSYFVNPDTLEAYRVPLPSGNCTDLTTDYLENVWGIENAANYITGTTDKSDYVYKYNSKAEPPTLTIQKNVALTGTSDVTSYKTATDLQGYASDFVDTNEKTLARAIEQWLAADSSKGHDVDHLFYEYNETKKQVTMYSQELESSKIQSKIDINETITDAKTELLATFKSKNYDTGAITGTQLNTVIDELTTASATAQTKMNTQQANINAANDAITAANNNKGLLQTLNNAISELASALSGGGDGATEKQNLKNAVSALPAVYSEIKTALDDAKIDEITAINLADSTDPVTAQYTAAESEIDNLNTVITNQTTAKTNAQNAYNAAKTEHDTAEHELAAANAIKELFNREVARVQALNNYDRSSTAKLTEPVFSIDKEITGTGNVMLVLYPGLDYGDKTPWEDTYSLKEEAVGKLTSKYKIPSSQPSYIFSGKGSDYARGYALDSLKGTFDADKNVYKKLLSEAYVYGNNSTVQKLLGSLESRPYSIEFTKDGLVSISHEYEDDPIKMTSEYGMEKNSDGTINFTTKRVYTDVAVEGNIADLTEAAKGDASGLLKKIYGISDAEADAFGVDGRYKIESSGNIKLILGDHTVQLEFKPENGVLKVADGASDGKVVMTFDQTEGKGFEAFGFQASESNPDEMEKKGQIVFDFSTVTNYNTNGSSTIKAVKGDIQSLNTGRAVGEMNGVSISTDGQIFATYSNGQTKLLGQIATAEFANASGLSKEGDNLYASTLNSGEATIQPIDTDGGYMNTGVLEMSNVDLSSQFTEMITTQRGFQANSRIITVSDTLLEELTNLKR